MTEEAVNAGQLFPPTGPLATGHAAAGTETRTSCRSRLGLPSMEAPAGRELSLSGRAVGGRGTETQGQAPLTRASERVASVQGAPCTSVLRPSAPHALSPRRQLPRSVRTPRDKCPWKEGEAECVRPPV